MNLRFWLLKCGVIFSLCFFGTLQSEFYSEEYYAFNEEYEPVSPCDCGCAEDPCNCCFRKWVWLPEGCPLFRPFIADPRQLTFSVAWRFNDQAATKNSIPVSFYDYLPIYRRFDVWPLHGQLEVGIDGGLWAIFDPCTESAPLLDADYYVGIPVTYAAGDWSFRLRGYHISCHLGDEFLLNHPGFDRRNPSAEYLDFFASWDLTTDLRFYAGLGYIVEQDRSFKCSRFYTEAGMEARIAELGFYSCRHNLFGQPFLAMHFRAKRDFHGHVDQTYAMGYEFSKLKGQCRRVRLFLEYHDGFSVEGQFCMDSTNYFAVRLSYGF